MRTHTPSPCYRTTGYREVNGEKHVVQTEFRRTGTSRWVVTTGVVNGVADYGQSVEFRTRKAALAAFND
jgi:hypothetical protein